ncbi:MAG TPA: polysaccharide deacetylase family protein [Lysobacter sp.]|nr:polysaccharide deacetylase family protein [Lysobacter sp.]
MNQDMLASARPGRRQQLARISKRLGLLPSIRNVRALVRGDDLRILAYHRVLDAAGPNFSFDVELVSASAECFREQMTLLRRRFHPMRFDEVLACVDTGRRLPRNAVLVSFDDGYDDNYRVAFPILQDLGMSAMFFVATGHIDSGTPYLYDWLVHMLCVTSADALELPDLQLACPLPGDLAGRRAIAARVLDGLKSLDDAAQTRAIGELERVWGMPVPASDRDCQPMTWGQLRQMHEAGMEVGSHGVHHRMLAKLPAVTMKAELVDSRQRIGIELGTPARVLSYPVGGHDAFNTDVEAAARAAGYEMACSYIAGTSRPDRNALFSLRRLPVERDRDQAWFEAVMAAPEIFCHRTRHRVPGHPA